MNDKRLLIGLLVLTTVGLLTGCGHDTAPIASDRICPAWPQVNVRRNDTLTEDTAREIEKANTGRESFGCPYERLVKVATK